MLTERIILVSIICITIVILSVVGTISNHLKVKNKDQEGGKSE